LAGSWWYGIVKTAGYDDDDIDLYSTLRRAPLQRYVSRCIVKMNVFSADRKDSMLSDGSRRWSGSRPTGSVLPVLPIYWLIYCFLFLIYWFIHCNITRCMFDLLPAAIAAGAMMDATYHPGVWRSVKYTCCDAINKRVAGCKHTTYDVPAPEMDASGRNSPGVFPRSSQPPAPAKKRKSVHLSASVW